MLWLTGNPATINAKPTHTETNVSRQRQIFVGLEFASPSAASNSCGSEMWFAEWDSMKKSSFRNSFQYNAGNMSAEMFRSGGGEGRGELTGKTDPSFIRWILTLVFSIFYFLLYLRFQARQGLLQLLFELQWYLEHKHVTIWKFHGQIICKYNPA